MKQELDNAETPGDVAQKWIEEIRIADKKWDKWRRRAKKIIDRYADEADDAISSMTDRPKRMNMLWSNTETIKPALYNETPQAEVGRRNRDKDPVGRDAAETLKRGLNFCIDAYDYDGAVRACVHDYALVAMGTARIVYEPVINGDKVAWEYTKADYVHWSDFLTNDARNWGEVRWVGFRHFFTRKELVGLSPEHGEKIPLDYKPDGIDEKDDKAERLKKAIVWEVWDKLDRKVRYISLSYPDAPVLERDPFCEFEGFFPCPRPLFGIQGRGIVPVPEYVLYQDQAETIDDLTNKIYDLTKALRAAGVYNASVKELQKLLDGETGNIMIPVEDWSSFVQGGGAEGVMQFVPLEKVAQAIISAQEARAQAKQDLYEATGLSDILRGASDPNETATAQQIKNKWGSLRIRDRQKEVQRFNRDLLRLKAEVMAEKFSPETIKAMSGLQLPDVAAQGQSSWQSVLMLLKDQGRRAFSIDIETDSTIEPDETEEKQMRVEFLTAMGGFIQQMGQIVAAAPETAPLMGAMLSFGVRGFKVGSELEDVIDQTMQQVQQRIQQAAQNPPPNPDQIKAETEMKKAELGAKVDMKKHGDEMQFKQVEMAGNMQLEVMKIKGQQQIGAMKAEQSAQIQRERNDAAVARSRA